jgi:lipoyl(octanoyl) transferase
VLGRKLVWRLISHEARPGSWNMAVDDVLMESVRLGGAPTLRLYAWDPPCLSFGRNQPALDRYPREELAAAGVDIVRRQTGGRAVLHDQELTYTVVAPARLFGSAREAYRTINDVFVRALQMLGVEASVHATAEAAPLLSTTPCFAEPAAGEVVADGRKLIGSAQVHRAGVLLQHGSLQLRRSPILDRVPSSVAELLDGGASYLQPLLPRTASAGEIEAAIARSWRSGAGDLSPASLTVAEEERAGERSAFYRDEDWTWRR